MTTAPSLSGYIRVACPACDDPNVWFTCNECSRSDHFVLDEGIVRCDCGAVYDRGTCTCGTEVAGAHLIAVAHDKGPLALADLQIAWGRIAVIVLILVAGVIAGSWYLVG